MGNNNYILKKTARLAGGLYLILVITGIFSIMFVSSQIIVSGDAVATAKNIIASEFLFRTGIINNIFSDTIWLFLALVLYRMFKQVYWGNGPESRLKYNIKSHDYNCNFFPNFAPS